jgi:hypothetical protein
MNITKEIRTAVRIQLRKDCRREALNILELCDDKDRKDFLEKHYNNDGSICCLILDFAKKKLVDAGKMEQNDSDAFGKLM